MKYNYIIKILLLLFCISTYAAVHAQEICNNAIDDDGDGLIDLNDEDCVCIGIVPSSLIPNPSFEEMTCCPTQNAQLNCAVGWIQASNPTTDYVHTCNNYLGNTNIPAFAPLPFPDGEGAVGFRDGENFTGAGYKEYVGSCLNSTMITGTQYRMDFFVGFRNNVNGSKDLKMAIFGNTNCASLPFGGNSNAVGCPANVTGFELLGELEVSGNNEWVNVVFNFEASKPYNVIVLGPSCDLNPQYQLNPYFYVDRLALGEASSFGVPYESITGQICENNLVLAVENNPLYTYQWYLDGVALLNVTDYNLELAATDALEGTYQVVINTPDGCFFSSEYELRIPPYYATDQAIICESDSIQVGDLYLSTAGYQEVTIPAIDGCDSIIQFTLDIIPTTYGTFSDIFCEGEVYELYDLNTMLPGDYQATTVNADGCDSIITVSLDMIEMGSGVELAESVEVNLGETVSISPLSIANNLIEFIWTDSLNQVISNESTLDNYLSLSDSEIYLESLDSYGCADLDTILISVDDSNTQIFIPNVFSPNRDGINDYFNFYTTSSFKLLKRFEIYDRWGEKVYETSNLISLGEFIGWDGTFRDKEAPAGVYAYLIEVEYLNDSSIMYTGSLTLIR